MNHAIPLSPWACSVWILVAVACSSTTSLPPPMPDCQGGKGVSCSVQPAAGGAGSAGGSGGEAGTTTEDDSSAAGTCVGAAAALGASSAAACQACIETGAESSTGGNCCQAYSLCGAACQEIIKCAVLCGANNGTCIVDTCINQNPSGATAFSDLNLCLQDCQTECPVFITMASEQ